MLEPEKDIEIEVTEENLPILRYLRDTKLLSVLEGSLDGD